MAYVTPRTWVTGELVTAAEMNQDVRDNIGALANPAACRVYHSVDNISIAHNTLTILGTTGATTAIFNSERYDTDSMHSTSVAPGRITFNTAGLYVVSSHMALAAAGDYTAFDHAIVLNGAANGIARADMGTATSSVIAYFSSVSTIYKFAVADYIYVSIQQRNGASAARNLRPGLTQTGCEFSAVRVGIG